MGHGDEEYTRRGMVVDVRSKMDAFRASKKYSTLFMVAFFVLGFHLVSLNHWT